MNNISKGLNKKRIMAFDLENNILAISTPSGRSLRAIIRLSGKDVFTYLQNIFVPKDCKRITHEKGFSTYQGNIYIEEEKISIPVYIYIMKAPNSYTREDIVEIHTFGSSPLLEILLETLVSSRNINNYKAGNGEEKISIRIAEPGEFTKRAFLNGRINLTEAESVLHIIRSQTESELLLAVSNLKGRLAEFLSEIQGELMKLSARIEASIDFFDQDIELISFNEIEKQLEHIKEKLSKIVEKDQTSRIFHDGIKTVFVGWPNTGKSSVFNKLLNYSKAIVTPINGTTRDTLEAVLNLEGINFRIIDTAGVMHEKGELESIIMKRIYDSVNDAQIVLFFIDGSMKLQTEQIEFFNSITTKNKIIVINKNDMPQEVDCKDFSLMMRTFPVVKTSALTGEGVGELKKILVSNILKKNVDISASGIAFTMRQKIILSQALETLVHITDSLNQKVSYEIMAIDLRSLLDTIGEVTGEVITDDILDIIFSEFCIGK
ncbi:MAG: tRNA uridine-5-carboxymethylaminomethyl(34) synthesis GTPase MnmE [Candidatus Scalindua sediminis]